MSENVLHELERLQRRVAELEHPDTSGLAEIVSDIEAEIVETVENILGRGLNVAEAYHLGRMIGSHGPQRTRRAILEARFKQDPIRYAYKLVVIQNRYGKAAVPRQDQGAAELRYWEAPDGYDPWA